MRECMPAYCVYKINLYLYIVVIFCKPRRRSQGKVRRSRLVRDSIFRQLPLSLSLSYSSQWSLSFPPPPFPFFLFSLSNLPSTPQSFALPPHYSCFSVLVCTRPTLSLFFFLHTFFSPFLSLFLLIYSILYVRNRLKSWENFSLSAEKNFDGKTVLMKIK